jgi:hypothetical protein
MLPLSLFSNCRFPKGTMQAHIQSSVLFAPALANFLIRVAILEKQAA